MPTQADEEAQAMVKHQAAAATQHQPIICSHITHYYMYMRTQADEEAEATITRHATAALSHALSTVHTTACMRTSG